MTEPTRLPPSADSIPRASIAMWRLTVEAVEGAWMTEHGGAAAVVTGVPVGGFNGVWTEHRDVSPSIVAELLDRVAATGLPYSLHLRANALPELGAVARARGMVLEAEEPVMILEDPSLLAAALGVTHLGTTAVFAVGTLPEHRGRGYGTALTARTVLDGLAEGAAWAWLQADTGATRLYERLGFRTVETASVWASD